MIRYLAGSLLLTAVLSPLSSVAATIQLPQTGQTGCWNASGASVPCAGTGQDGAYRSGSAWPTTRFDQFSSDCVVDQVTGLMWYKNTQFINIESTMPMWESALNFINGPNVNQGSNICGDFDDWRLPNRLELMSLVNYQQPDSTAWLDSMGFQYSGIFNNVPRKLYWSSSSGADDPLNNKTIMSLVDGSQENIGPDATTIKAMMVRWGYKDTIPKTGQTESYAANDDGALEKGVAWSTPRFTESNNTVTDTLTGLVWTKDAGVPAPTACGPGVAKTWQGALDYVACLNQNAYLGYRSWRLPNVKELSSVIDASNFNPALPDGHLFTNVKFEDGDYYWTSTTVAGQPANAYTVDMYYGLIGASDDKSLTRMVWPVRGALGAISINPYAGDFPVTPPGGNSTPIEFTLSNGGDSSVLVSSINTTDAGQFTVAAGGSAPCTSLTPTLAPGASCTVAVTFRPNSSGVKTASLQVANNDSFAPLVKVGLSGTGEAVTTYTLAVSVAGAGGGWVALPSGTTCSSNCNWVFNSGVTAGLTAESADGSTFSSWSGGACSGSNPACSVLMNANKSVTATFDVVPRAKVGSTFFGLLANAYAAVNAGNILQSRALIFTENLMLNRSDVPFTLRGGYDENFAFNTGYTVLDGVLTINGGSVVVDRLVVK